MIGSFKWFLSKFDQSVYANVLWMMFRLKCHILVLQVKHNILWEIKLQVKHLIYISLFCNLIAARGCQWVLILPQFLITWPKYWLTMLQITYCEEQPIQLKSDFIKRNRGYLSLVKSLQKYCNTFQKMIFHYSFIHSLLV